MATTRTRMATIALALVGAAAHAQDAPRPEPPPVVQPSTAAPAPAAPVSPAAPASSATGATALPDAPAPASAPSAQSGPTARQREVSRRGDFVLSTDDRWIKASDDDVSSEAGQLRQAQLALARGEAPRALNLASGWLERYPASRLRPVGLLIKGDSLLSIGDEYKALYEYEEIARKYAASEVFVTALEREFQIATAYANGLRRKFMGTFRWLSGDEEAQELLIRIQERLPGSELAERAGMELADFYFRKRELQMAADAYDLFVRNYPKSRQVEKAKLRHIYSLCASYKGPLYDARGLFEASERLRDLQVTDPITAQRVGADALLVRIYESEAMKLLVEAEWYAYVDDPISAERCIRAIMRKYPKSIAALNALRAMPTLYARLPRSVTGTCPDYPRLRKELLGLEWDEGIEMFPGGVPSNMSGERLPEAAGS
ncbi:MAG: outer membrane protein assembly factor BamD [Phycisphaerales bacterium]|nr:outer membrane protein assembly factor BamD [Phycisphaerales bacterium]